MIAKIFSVLRPSAGEIRELALRETDPSHWREFEPITLGFSLNACLLLLIGAAAFVTTPLRLVRAFFEKK